MALACSALAASTAHASEGGASFYLLGEGGPGAAVSPPVDGVFFDQTYYIYHGSAGADRRFVTGGNVVAGLDVTLVASFSTVLWVPSQNVLGGTLGLGVAVPLGAPMVDVDAVITGPRGRQLAVKAHDSALLVGDPVASASLGWKADKFHFQLATTVNVPVGKYREGEIANLAFHRWVGDASLAATWQDPKSGWDLSAKAGLTFNGANEATDYNTGTEFHLEGAVEKRLSRTFSAGLQGYYYKQITGDSGAGATLGPFEGEVAALGATAALNVMMGRSPATFRIRALKEFAVTNRLEGEAFFLSLTLPLHMRLPPAGGAE